MDDGAGSLRFADHGRWTMDDVASMVREALALRADLCCGSSGTHGTMGEAASVKSGVRTGVPTALPSPVHGPWSIVHGPRLRGRSLSAGRRSERMSRITAAA